MKIKNDQFSNDWTISCIKLVMENEDTRGQKPPVKHLKKAEGHINRKVVSITMI